MERSSSYITTIPGIGPVLGAVIISEIGDATRFSVPAKLIAYAHRHTVTRIFRHITPIQLTSVTRATFASGTIASVST